MATFVKVEDFKSGPLRVAYNNLSEKNLQGVIDAVERVFLPSVLGAELTKLLIADYDPSTGFSEQRFTDIFEPFEVDNEKELVISEGIKKMLMLMIYFEYVRFQPIQNRETGNTTAINENSEQVSGVSSGLYLRYNESIKTAHAIQWKIRQSEDYPEYNGQNLKVTSWV